MSEYTVQSADPKELIAVISNHEWKWADVKATRKENLVTVQELAGNCLDELDAILDSVPGSYYILSH